MGFDYRRDASGIVTITMDMDGQSANTMSPVYHDEMGATVARLEAEEGLTGVIFASAKKTFFAGGDLHGLLVAETGDDAYKAWLNEDKGYLRRLERLPVPVVAAINGAALGGGFEICLSCNHRVIVDSPAAVVGLPEVTLGLLPGAGGVARLPRTVQLDQALDLLLSGRFVQPQEALSLGLVDRIVASVEDLIPAAIDWITGPGAQAVQPWDRDHAALDTDVVAKGRALIAETREEVTVRTRDKMPAPLRILEIAEEGLALDIDRTLLLETEKFASLLGLPETRAAISLNFFAANAVRSGKMRPKGDRVKIKVLAVLGEGPAAEALAKSASTRITTLRDTSGAPEVTLCFAGQDQPEGAAITGVEVTDTVPEGADRFGFCLPVVPARSRLVEIVPGAQTTDAVLCRAYDLFQSLGHTPIIVADVPGHYIARLQAAYLSEALALKRDGLSGLEIDTLAYSAGMIIAPLEPLGDPKVRALVPDALGVEGWSDAPATTGSATADLRADAADRLLFAQSIAALTALAQGIMGSEEECDLASVIGAGVPPHTGGTLRLIRGLGVDAFAARAATLAARYGARFDLRPEFLNLMRRDGARAA